MNKLKTLQVGLVSYGMSGKVFHAPLINADQNLHLHSILQRSSDSAKMDYPDAHIAKHFDELIENSALDIIVVNTPNEHHFPMAKAALLAGKHVVLEKPFTLTLEEGNALIKLAEQQQKMLAIFHNKRLEPDHLTIADIVKSQTLGRIVDIEWHYDRYRHVVTHKKWKEDNLPGSGTWWDLGVHMVDSMLCIFGKPTAVTADMRSLRRAEGSIDYFNVCFHYPDMRAVLRSSTYVSEKGATVSVHGDKGSFLIYGSDVQEKQLMQGLTPRHADWAKLGEDCYGILHRQTESGSARERIPSQIGCYQNFYGNIAQHILKGERLQFQPQQALLAVEMLLAADKSHAERRTIDID